jgi:tRNA A-37 threonylcarbamoyl transferase component Bud32/tetratricopeptide (TPR) repeat protein
MDGLDLNVGATATPDGSATSGQSDGQESDLVLGLMELWDRSYARGEELTPESLAGGDPALADALRILINKRKHLYAIIGLHEKSGDVYPGTMGPLPSFPGHETLGEIGQGGMGVVYKARDRKLGRIVAIKTIMRARGSTRDQVARFLREARAVARLAHPNIIAIHAIEELDGQPYLSLEYVEGGDLSRKIGQGPLDPAEAAELVETIARAMQFAHDSGVVHRDLKPKNVLLTLEGVPKISDFGLAKLLDDDSSGTSSGEILGTPSYMAPEQVEGRTEGVGPAADLYSLGVILYQGLTGRLPIVGPTSVETLKLLTSFIPVPPRRLQPNVPRDVETICLRCLEKEPGKRYPGAGDLADDLRRFREGRPIVARPVGSPERAWRWCRRKPTAAALLGLTSACIAGVIATAIAFAALERTQAEAMKVSRDRTFRALGTILFTEDDSLIPEEMRPYRRKLNENGLSQFLGILPEIKDDPQSDSLLAKGKMARANLLSESGDREGAGRVASEAVETFERSSGLDRRSSPYREQLAELLHLKIRLAPEREDRLSAARRSIELLQGLLDEGPTAEKIRHWTYLIAQNRYNLGGMEFEESKDSGSREAALRAIEELEDGKRRCEQRLLGASDDSFHSLLAMFERYLCRAHRHMATLEKGRAPAEATRHLQEAVAAGEQAAEMYRSLADRHPDVFNYVTERFLADQELGTLLNELGRRDDAIATFRDVFEMLEEQDSRPGQPVSRRVMIQESIVSICFNWQMSYDSDPVRYYREQYELTVRIQQICDKLSLIKELSPNLSKAFASSCFGLADYQEEQGKTPDLDLLFESERQWDRFLRHDPRSDEARAFLVIVRQKLADELEAQGRPDEAIRRRPRCLESVQGHPKLMLEIANVYNLNAGFTGKFPTKLEPSKLEARRARFARYASSMFKEAIRSRFLGPGAKSTKQ